MIVVSIKLISLQCHVLCYKCIVVRMCHVKSLPQKATYKEACTWLEKKLPQHSLST